MTESTKGYLILSLIPLVVLVLLGLIVVHVDNSFKGNQQLEIQVHQTKASPDGKWTAVVQLEVYSSGFVSIPTFAVRLKGPAQKDPMGDLVISTADYSDSPPSIDWSGGKLIVTLAADEKSENLAKDPQKSKMFFAPKLEKNPVNGVPIVLQYDEPPPTTQKGELGNVKGDAIRHPSHRHGRPSSSQPGLVTRES
ncbi:MAG TPA: hypothetical protein VFE58_10185 [Tepidisphaeraceae bacterium]|jgi:hypothetical protein|nr:hypothetical protein [Tepidisphaeraceae bacterium]